MSMTRESDPGAAGGSGKAKPTDIEVTCTGLARGERPESTVVVIFGASGDLARRQLLPSLFALRRRELLPERFAIVGFARTDWDDAAFRTAMREAVDRHLEDVSRSEWESFAQHLSYVRGDIGEPPSGAYAGLRMKIAKVRESHDIADHLLFHLSTPPRFYSEIVQKLDACDLLRSASAGSGWRRVIVEKPLGRDEDSARRLERSLSRHLAEDQIYRIDHFLGKETVQNLLAFRFSNPSFEPIWNRNYIDHVQITVAENIGIGDRGSFYEETGVVRDMIQNHLLQLLCLTCMEPPVRYDARSLRDETVKVLTAIEPIDVENDAVRGQYDRGEQNGETVPAYRQEEDVASSSMTPTFAALKLRLANRRWAGVPFYLRTGKRLATKLSEIAVQFRPVSHRLFPREAVEASSTAITFRLQPEEGIRHQFLAKQPGPDICLRPVTMNFRYGAAFGEEDLPGAYEALLLDAMQGDSTLFARADWIEAAWTVVDPLNEHWESTKPSFPNYRAGSWGPEAAAELLRRDGRGWVPRQEQE